MPPAWIQESDRWEGYASQRDQLLGLINDYDVRNVWFLTGDFHVGFVSHVEAAGPSRRVREIAVGPGGSGGNPLPALEEGGFLPPGSVFPPDQFIYGSGQTSVVTTITFDPLRDVVRARFVNATNGEVLFDEVLRETD
jgi:hypothetical protein